MKRYTIIIALILCTVNLFAQNNDRLPAVEFIEYHSHERVWFARYGQFQLNFEYRINPTNGLPMVKDPVKQIEKLNKCLEIAKNNSLNVIVFPELAMSLPEEYKSLIISKLTDYSTQNDAIIIAGTYYDNNRYCKNLTILPNGIHYSYKTRPSIFEVSPVVDQGMQMVDTLHVFSTKYGNFMTLVCVDLISDDANYMARRLSNRSLIDILININYNPKSQEFMREASSMAARHPLFVSLTNVTLFQKGGTYDGNEFGNTSIFGSINNEQISSKLLPAIPDYYKTSDNKRLQPAYRSMLGMIPPEAEGVLIYDLNLRVIRAPSVNNAPDQGYPTIKNVKVIQL